MTFWLSDGASGGLPSHASYVWERRFFLSAVPLTTVGFVVLADLGVGRVLARAGATAYLFGGLVGVVAETLELSDRCGASGSVARRVRRPGVSSHGGHRAVDCGRATCRRRGSVGRPSYGTWERW